ncbi:MAG TPA: hypothetical protein VF200_10675 [Woeseiaceae bacterium]
MPEFTALQLALLASLFVIGIGVGWLLRSDRSAREKIAVNAGWQEQLEICRAESERLRETLAAGEERAADTARTLAMQDERIARLRRQLARWHARVPPLIASYRERERALYELEAELERATRRLAELEAAQATCEADRNG